MIDVRRCRRSVRAEAGIVGVDSLRITVMSGAADGRVFEFEDAPVVVGRHPDDDVVLPDDYRVSRHHARITRQDKGYFLEDVGAEGIGSTNGTYLDGLRVQGKASISPGDMFLVGTVWLQLNLIDGSSADYSEH